MPQNHYLPLLILSIYDAEVVKKYIGKSTPGSYSKFHYNNHYWEIEEKNHFSLVYFLIGSEINHKAMIESHFPSIFNIKASPLLMNYFEDEDKVEIEIGMIKRVNDFGLLIGYTDKVIPKPSRQMFFGPTQMKTNDRIETAYGIILTPTDEMIMESLR